MNKLVAFVHAQPEEERLEAALMLLADIAGGDAELSMIAATHGLTRKQSEVIAILSKAAPRAVSKEYIFQAMYPYDDDAPELKIIDVMVFQIRRRNPSIQINTNWGIGYSLPAPLAMEQPA